MTHVHPKPMPNWCPQVNPDEAWTARCVKEKIAADAKRHRCQKKVGHDDNVHTCKCGLRRVSICPAAERYRQDSCSRARCSASTSILI